MNVVAVNLAKPTTIKWNGKKEVTGIYKHPVDHPIALKKTGVTGDTIGNPKVHGGTNKACYLFSAHHYPYWKEQYPDLNWNWGMFGENITLDLMDEAKIRIGDVYKLGSTLVEISQPREPCYKFGLKFGDQKAIAQFVDYGYPGTYVRVLKEGYVTTGDTMVLEKQSENPLTVRQFYQLLFSKEKPKDVVRLAIENEALPLYKRERLKKYL